MIKESILKLANKEDLSYDIAEQVMSEIMSGEASPVQMSAFLTALSLKGETIEEITACASGMRKHCIKLLHDVNALEIVGTGGDQANTFNISTISAIVVSATGVPVAKHGNRAASSKCGAADVLEALGVNIAVEPEVSTKILEEIGLCFLFAQNYHIAMKYVAPVRKELGIRTVFNLLGPLCNPAGANMELMGVYDGTLVEPLAKVLYNLGVKNAMVVHGQDGLDEISICAPTSVCEVRNGKFNSYTLNPEELGLSFYDSEDLVGGIPKENAKIARDILAGKQGAKRDAVVLNSAAAIYIANPSLDMMSAIRMAQETIDSGEANKQLEKFIKLSNEEIA